MSRLQNDMAALRDCYLKTLGWTACICAATGVGVALVAPAMQALVLGAKWNGIAPMMIWLEAIGMRHYRAWHRSLFAVRRAKPAQGRGRA